jgi:hypothetical protein
MLCVNQVDMIGISKKVLNKLCVCTNNNLQGEVR